MYYIKIKWTGFKGKKKNKKVYKKYVILHNLH